MKVKNSPTTTIQLGDGTTEYGTMSLTKADGTTEDFYPIQFHFHAGSEHTFNGAREALEVHVVHKSKTNSSQLAVIGIMFSDADNIENPFLASLKLNTIGQRLGKVPLTQTLSMTTGKFYHYQGSLTTPACNEIVEWVVMADILPMSTAQKTIFTSIWSGLGLGTYRNTQAIGARTVYHNKNMGGKVCPY